MNQPWQRDSNETASGKLGAVQTVAAEAATEATEQEDNE
jgi:hypothetical protein